MDSFQNYSVKWTRVSQSPACQRRILAYAFQPHSTTLQGGGRGRWTELPCAWLSGWKLWLIFTPWGSQGEANCSCSNQCFQIIEAFQPCSEPISMVWSIIISLMTVWLSDTIGSCYVLDWLLSVTWLISFWLVRGEMWYFVIDYCCIDCHQHVKEVWPGKKGSLMSCVCTRYFLIFICIYPHRTLVVVK